MMGIAENVEVLIENGMIVKERERERERERTGERERERDSE